MAIVIQCDCGRTFQAKDEDAGRRARCPGCQKIVHIPAPVGEPVAAGAGVPKKVHVDFGVAPRESNRPGAKRPGVAEQMPRFEMGSLSMGMKLAIGAVVLIVGFVLFFKLGPARAQAKWEHAEKQANVVVQDVVTRALQVSNPPEEFNPTARAQVMEWHFMEPGYRMVMPATVEFQGRCSGGKFKGVYHTEKEEVEVWIDGRPGTRITGRDANGNVQVEFNGQPVALRAQQIKKHEPEDSAFDLQHLPL